MQVAFFADSELEFGQKTIRLKLIPVFVGFVHRAEEIIVVNLAHENDFAGLVIP